MKDTSRAADISLIMGLNFEFIETVIHDLLKTKKNSLDESLVHHLGHFCPHRRNLVSRD